MSGEHKSQIATWQERREMEEAMRGEVRQKLEEAKRAFGEEKRANRALWDEFKGSSDRLCELRERQARFRQIGSEKIECTIKRGVVVEFAREGRDERRKEQECELSR